MVSLVKIVIWVIFQDSLDVSLEKIVSNWKLNHNAKLCLYKIADTLGISL